MMVAALRPLGSFVDPVGAPRRLVGAICALLGGGGLRRLVGGRCALRGGGRRHLVGAPRRLVGGVQSEVAG
jgi:hypothetical protein